MALDIGTASIDANGEPAGDGFAYALLKHRRDSQDIGAMLMFQQLLASGQPLPPGIEDPEKFKWAGMADAAKQRTATFAQREAEFMIGWFRANSHFLACTDDVKTSAYTAVAGDLVRANPTGGAFLVTLPASPKKDDRVMVKNVSSSSNQIVVVGTIDGSANALLDTPYASILVQWDGTSSWLQLFKE